MATERRYEKRYPRQDKRTNTIAIIVLALLLLVGFFLGRITSPKTMETVTVAETLDVPTYDEEIVPDLTYDVFYYDVPLSKSLQRYIYEICADERVPVTLVLAMIEHESGFNTEAVSSSNDYGLMQINEVNSEMLEEKYRCPDLLNPYQNIYCGVKIISKYINRYDGNINRALMAYNMGDYGATKAWENGVTTIASSTAVLELMQDYERVTFFAENN